MIECGPGLIDWATFFMFTTVRKETMPKGVAGLLWVRLFREDI